MAMGPYSTGGDTINSPNAQYEKTQLFLARAKLKASSRTSALLSGFAMIAMVELNMAPSNAAPLPEGLLIAFAVCTVILVSLHLLALMISTCLLPHVEAAAGTMADQQAQQALLIAPLPPTQHHYHQQSEEPQRVQDKDSFYQPHLHMKVYIEMAWMCSTVFGIMLFLLEVGLICWMQFYPVSPTAAYVSTCVLVPIVIFFLAVIFKFYQRVVNSRMKNLHVLLARSAGGFHDREDMITGNGEQNANGEDSNHTAGGMQII